MKNVSKLLIIALIITFAVPVHAQKPAGVNLKVGQSFYFEGDTDSKEGEGKEESMVEIKRTPFYKTTWFITTVSILAIAGASTGVYFLTRKDPSEGNIVTWQKNSK